MTTVRAMTFGVQTAPSTDVRKSDKVLYDEVIEDVKLAAALGYESVWMLEHHFSDYYPTPSPRALHGACRRALPGYRARDLGAGAALGTTRCASPKRLRC